MKAKLWTEEDIEFLKQNYPMKGKMFCAEALGRNEGSIRKKAATLGLRLNPEGDFFKDFQTRAATSKTGKKRPDQADVMKNLHKVGKLGVWTDAQREANSIRKKKWMQENEHPRGYLGHKHSDETLQKISKKSKEAWADPNSKLNSEENKQRMSDETVKRVLRRTHIVSHSRGAQGRRDDLGGLYVRSSWEANYCRYLNHLVSTGKIHKWEYEPDIFLFEAIKRGTRTYTPDFKVWDSHDSEPYYVELKGYFDAKSKTKMKRMAKYYPKTTLFLVDAKAYKALEKEVSHLFQNWERK